MTTNELEKKVNDLRELRRMADELSAEITAIEDAIKADMTAKNTDSLFGASFKITWKEVVSNRLDSKALKSDLPELYERYSKATSSRRFIVAA